MWLRNKIEQKEISGERDMMGEGNRHVQPPDDALSPQMDFDRSLIRDVEKIRRARLALR